MEKVGKGYTWKMIIAKSINFGRGHCRFLSIKYGGFQAKNTKKYIFKLS